MIKSFFISISLAVLFLSLVSYRTPPQEVSDSDLDLTTWVLSKLAKEAIDKNNPQLLITFYNAYKGIDQLHNRPYVVESYFSSAKEKYSSMAGSWQSNFEFPPKKLSGSSLGFKHRELLLMNKIQAMNLTDIQYEELLAGNNIEALLSDKNRYRLLLLDGLEKNEVNGDILNKVGQPFITEIRKQLNEYKLDELKPGQLQLLKNRTFNQTELLKEKQRLAE